MGLLHDEDDLGPLQELGRDGVFCVPIDSGGRALQARAAGKHLLGRRASQAVLTANEQNAFHLDCWMVQVSVILLPFAVCEQRDVHGEFEKYPEYRQGGSDFARRCQVAEASQEEQYPRPAAHRGALRPNVLAQGRPEVRPT